MSIRTGMTVGLLLGLASQGDAQQHATRSTSAGVYTAAQAARGAETYAGMCTGCHTPASHTGEVFTNAWNGRPVAELFGFIRAAMPKNEPGSLSPEEYVSIIAYLLKLNGMPAGKEALPADSLALDRIRVDAGKQTP